jgi:hypothetical protein
MHYGITSLHKLTAHAFAMALAGAQPGSSTCPAACWGLYPNILLNAVSKRPFSVPSIMLITLTNALLSYTETQYA